MHRVQELKLQTELYSETQSSSSSEQALIQMLDTADTINSLSNISSEFGGDSDGKKDNDLQTQLEPSAPYMPPSPETEGVPRSSSYENLYQGISMVPEVPVEPVSAHDLDIGDRFDTRQTEQHLKGVGRASSFEDLYAVGMAPEAQAFDPEGESAGPAASWNFFAARPYFFSDPQTYILPLCMPLLLRDLPSVIDDIACVKHRCRRSSKSPRAHWSMAWSHDSPVGS